MKTIYNHLREMSDIIFTHLKTNEKDTAWVEHTPFAFYLISQLKPKTFVELGTHYGCSYFAFCQAINTLKLEAKAFAVDTWTGDVHSGLYNEEVFNYAESINNSNYSHFSNLLRMNFDDANKLFEDGSIDLLHIDGMHTYESVKHDYETWLPKMSNAGVIIFHDTIVKENNFGVWRLIEEIREKYPYFEFKHGFGLGVFCVGKDVNSDFLDFMHLSQNEGFIQKLFEHLGSKSLLELWISKLNQHIFQLSELNQNYNQSLVEKDSLLAENQQSLQNKDKIINDLNDSFIQKEATLKQELETLINTLKQTKEEAKEKFEVRVNELKQKELEIVTTKELLSQSIKERDQYVLQIAKLSHELRKQESELLNIRMSNSYRLSVILLWPVKFLMSFQLIRLMRTKLIIFWNTRLIKRSGIFDEAYYLSNNADVKASKMSPTVHYLLYGGFEGRKPSKGFSSSFYLKKYSDVEIAGINPLLHYIKSGKKQGRMIHEDQDFQNPSNNEGYLTTTISEPDRKEYDQYSESNDISFISQSELFDADYYLDNNNDVKEAGINPAEHYYTYGWKEGRNPSASFDTLFYLLQNEDVKASGMNPLVHFIKYGKEEGRSINEFQLQHAPLHSSQGPEVILVSGESRTPGHNYRVINYMNTYNDIGFRASWITPDLLVENLSWLDDAKILVIWRTLYGKPFQTIVDYAKRKSLPIVYDIDDLMFDPSIAEPELIDSIRSLHPNKEFVKIYCSRIQTAIYHADFCTCTTAELASSLQKLGKPTFVLPNGYSSGIIELSQKLFREKEDSSEFIRIGYAGGTLTHQKDFSIALPAILKIMSEYDHTILTIFGEVLNLNEFQGLNPFKDRIELRKFVPHHLLQEEIARFDINIAPLEINLFCNAKSELKFFEAALLRIPTIASPTPPYIEAINHGVNGFIAHHEEDWYKAFKLLITDKDLRKRTGKNAFDYCLYHFGNEQRIHLLSGFIELALPTMAKQIVHRISRNQAVSFSKSVLKSGQPIEGGQSNTAVTETIFEHHSGKTSKTGVVYLLQAGSRYHIQTLESVHSQICADLDLAIIFDSKAKETFSEVEIWVKSHNSRFNNCIILGFPADTNEGEKLNHAIDTLQTDYILPLISGCILFPDHINKSLQVIVNSGAAVVYSRSILINRGHINQNPHLIATISGQTKWDPGDLGFYNDIPSVFILSKAIWAKTGGFDRSLKDPIQVRHAFLLKCIENGFFGMNIPQVLSNFLTESTDFQLNTISTHLNKHQNELNHTFPWLDSISANTVRKSILFIGHDDDVAGAQILLLSLLRWFKNNTEISLKLILLKKTNRLFDQFTEICPVIVWEEILHKHPDHLKRSVVLNEFSGKVDLIYGNTVLSTTIYDEFSFLNAPFISHIHELENAIRILVDKSILERLRNFPVQFIACSEPVAENLKNNHHINQEKISMINEFIEIPIIDLDIPKYELRKQLGLNPDEFIVFGCGTISHRKGVDLFIETAILLKKQGFSKFHFYWIGENRWDNDPSTIRIQDWSILEQKINENGISDHITFMGLRSETINYFLAGDIFYLPSREDPFPLVALEAAYCRLPVICFKGAGGIQDFVEEDAGFAVDFENTIQAAEKILILANDKSKLKQLGNQARKKILSRHTLDTAAPRIFEVCRNVMDSGTKKLNIYSSPDIEERKTKLVFVTTNDGSADGGSEQLWIQAAKTCSQKGFRVMVVIKKWTPEPKFISELEKSGIEVVFKDYDPFAKIFMFSPDLLVFSTGDQDEGIEWFEFCNQHSFKYIIVNHLTKEPSFWPVRNEITERLKNGYLKAQLVLFTGKNNHQVMEKRLNAKILNAGLFYNPVDVNRDIFIPFPSLDQGIKIAIVGSLLKIHKGQHLAIELMNRSKWRSRSITINIYGKGPDEISLRKLVGQYGLNNVRFHGHIQDIQEVWKENHALLMPSFMEGLPLVLVAAMMCARVPIVTYVGAHGEVIRDNDTGFIAKAPTIDSMDEALERAYQRSDQWEAIGQKARRDILKYIPENPIDHFIKLLIDQLERNNKDRS